MKKQNIVSSILMVSILILAFPSFAFASAGKVIYVIGKVLVVNESGEESRIKRSDELNQGDTVITNERSQLQIRMDDGTLLAIRPNSKFKVDEYVYQDNVETDKTHYRLLKGTFRSITGAIGKKKKSSFVVITPVGTIGIRGTDFTARLCDSDCGDSTDGLYVGVMQGAVVLENDSGELYVIPGDFGFIQDQSMEPVQLDEAPGALLFASTNTETNTVVASSNDTNSETEIPTDTTKSSSTEIVVATTTTNSDDLINVTKVSDFNSEPVVETVVDPIIEPVIADAEVILDPVVDPDPTPEPEIVLATTGTATYSVNSYTTRIAEDAADLNLNTDLTNLTVNFVDPSVDVTVTINELATGTEDDLWIGTNTLAIANDGTFSGDLNMSQAYQEYGTSGNVSGDFSATLETNGSPSNANMSYDMTDGGTMQVAGDIIFNVDAP